MTQDNQNALIDAYAQWTVDAWSASLDQPSPERCRVVMGYGLFGECGEVMEVIESGLSTPVDLGALTKEMGDVVYYWCRIAREFGLTASDLWPARPSPSLPVPTLFQITLALTARCGAVAEAMKKEVRDSHLDMGKLQVGLAGAAAAVMQLARHFAIPLEVIFEANRTKINSRMAAGTNRGSGDDR